MSISSFFSTSAVRYQECMESHLQQYSFCIVPHRRQQRDFRIRKSFGFRIIESSRCPKQFFRSDKNSDKLR
eukprot:IDg21057t1